ncbi:MAG: M28 family peptidase [Tannerellaceae bacterium]
MKKRVLICVLLAGMTTAFMQAQDAAVKKIIEIGQNDNQVMNHLDILSNRIGGRLIGSDAYENAVEWSASKFREWGLQVELQEAGVMPVGFNRGPWFGKILGEEGMNLHFVTPSYSSGTKGLQQGHVVLEPRTQEEFNRMKGQLKGAWVLIGGSNNGWAIEHSAHADSLRAAIITENNKISEQNNAIEEANWTNKTNTPLLPYKEEPALFYKEMCQAGILGIIQSSTVPLRALYDKMVVKDPTMNFDKLPTVPDIKLDEHQYAVIRQMAQERRSFLLEFDIRNHFKPGPVKYYNVVASIKGSKYPNEYVMASGHLDAYDVATGGVDDGSGVTPVMEAARMIMKAGGKPKRTMLFCLFAGEEFGLLGATAWCKTNADKLDKISNLFNRDGGPTPPVGLNVPKAMYDDFARISEPINSINPDFPFTLKVVEPRRKPKVAGGTDASVFTVAGVPTIGFVTRDVKGYNFSYDEIWHTERDLYTKSIPEYQQHAATVTAIITLGVANLDKQLSREGLYEKE